MQTGGSKQRVVIFVLSQPAYMPYLVVALATLRQHWSGDIRVYAWPESVPFVRQVANDPRLSIDLVLCDPDYRGKNGQFVNKILVMNSLEPDVYGLYLDADIIVAGDISPLFDLCDDFDLVATQFCDWTTNGSIICNRVKRLRAYSAIPAELIDEVINFPYPSPNGGVFACRPDTDVMRQWHSWTMVAARDVFIADEAVLQLLQIQRPEMHVVQGGKYNCSTMRFQPKNLPDGEVVIWHGHGNGFARPDKAARGHAMWMNLYRQCLQDDTGNVSQWGAECMMMHKYFKNLSPLPGA